MFRKLFVLGTMALAFLASAEANHEKAVDPSKVKTPKTGHNDHTKKLAKTFSLCLLLEDSIPDVVEKTGGDYNKGDPRTYFGAVVDCESGKWFKDAYFFSWCIHETCGNPLVGCNTHIAFSGDTVISFSSVVNTYSDDFDSYATVTGINGPKKLQRPINLAIDTSTVEYKEDFEVTVYALEFSYVTGKGWNPFYEYELTSDFGDFRK